MLPMQFIIAFSYIKGIAGMQGKYYIISGESYMIYV
jgi:hypothetical protein